LVSVVSVSIEIISGLLASVVLVSLIETPSTRLSRVFELLGIV
jgi:hypothetical protein